MWKVGDEDKGKKGVEMVNMEQLEPMVRILVVC